HLLNLINDVLDLSKIAAGRVELQREWIDAAVIAEAAVAIVRPLANKQGVELHSEIGADLPLIYADAIRLRQVLYNLLSNAIKFTRAGGRVRFAAWEAGDQLHLAVSDTGVGIRREDLPRLFREFDQLETDLGNKPEGTGLGLALSRRLVQLLGGRIAVSSELGVGSTFTVSLPLQDLVGEPTTTPEAKGAPLVLVVDDDPTAADLITGHLRMAGLSVAWARTGDEALDMAADLHPVAITLDILMPGLDGWTVLERLRTDPRTVASPVIVVSVVDEASRCLELGAAHYLVKPVDRAALLRSLEAVGVPVEPPLTVLVVGPERADVAHVASHLRAVGHRVFRAVGAVSAREVQGADVVLLDGTVDLVDGTFPAVPGGSRPTPVLLLGADDIEPRHTDLARVPHVEPLAWPDALDAVRVCQAVRDAVSRAREAPLTPVDELRPASRHALVQYLRAAVHRAERGIRQVVVVGARVATWDGDRAFDARAIGLRLRPGDFVAMPEPGVVVLVVEGVPQRASASIAARFADLVAAAFGAPSVAVCTAWYPTDAPDAEGLLARVLERLSAQQET
ncbi:MAG: ATP-binding protein, partial [Myxococcota bacterium]